MPVLGVDRQRTNAMLVRSASEGKGQAHREAARGYNGVDQFVWCKEVLECACPLPRLS